MTTQSDRFSLRKLTQFYSLHPDVHSKILLRIYELLHRKINLNKDFYVKILRYSFQFVIQ